MPFMLCGDDEEVAPLRGLSPDPERDLTCLRWHWGDAYEITRVHGMFRAVRRDNGAAVCAPSAWKLRQEIFADYEARPVPRDVG